MCGNLWKVKDIMRFFNTAGPVNMKDHYCLSPLERFDLDEILFLIEQKKYFVLHAPRQTGKTTCLLAMMDYLNKEDKYRCLYFNVEIAQAAREDVKEGMRAILNQMASWARTSLGDRFVKEIWPEVLEESGENAALGEVLTLWVEQSPKPLVLLIDEIDALVGDTLISVLRQLRAGYTQRPALFITGGSAFNIKAKSLRLGDFSKEEVFALFRQHTEETGQAFDYEALDLVWYLTQGQPWLSNALGYEVCFETKEARNRSAPITVEMIEQAKENIILRRETHIDQLVDKLQEERVRRVISPILRGDSLDRMVSQDDIQYVLDLGLVSRTEEGLQVSNRIYREIIPRELSFITQLNLESTIRPAWYVGPDGRLDMESLLSAFQEFFREHSEHWVERFQYKEAGPQLLLQAFLQRIVNTGGRVEREYGLGRMRTDLLVVWRYDGGIQKFVIELKILHKSLERTVAEGLEQTSAYMDRCGADEGHLVIFDRSKEKNWDEKIFQREEEYQGRMIKVWGM